MGGRSRLLSHGLKNVMVITYDELLTRLENHIKVLEQYQTGGTAISNPRTPDQKLTH
jgi:hypothetical protein